MSVVCKSWMRCGVMGLVAMLFNFLLWTDSMAATTQRPSAGDRGLQAFCTHNVFVQRYNCSLQQVQAAAMQGDPDAEYALAYLYYYGIGTQEDENTAMVWMNKAAAQGQPLAIRAVKVLQRAEFPELGSVKMRRSGDSHSGSASSGAIGSTINKAHQSAPSSHFSRSLDRHTQAKPTSKPTTVRSSLAAKAKVAGVQKNKQGVWARCDLSKVVQLPAHLAALPTGSRARCTLQLVASSSKAGIQAFVKASQLTGARVYQTQLHARPWYVVAYGLFPDRRAALRARRCLQQRGTADLRKAYAKAWPVQLTRMKLASAEIRGKKQSS